MNYKKISDKTRSGYLLNILFLVLILSLKLYNYLSENKEYYEYTIPTYNELVISEAPQKEQLFSTYCGYISNILDNVCEAYVFHSYNNALFSYNHLILTKFKILDSSPVYNCNIISLLQCKNIWHKSPEEEPGTFC